MSKLVFVLMLVLASLVPAHNITIESSEIPMVLGTYGRFSQNTSMFFWPAFDTTREWWDLTQYPGGLWTRLGLRGPSEGRPGALDSMVLDPPSPQVCEMDTMGNNTNQWVYLYKNQFGLYVDGIDFTQAEYRFVGNYRPDYYAYATPIYHTGSWNTAWQWRYELFPGVFIVFNEQHEKKIVSKGKVKVPMSGNYYWPCLVIRDHMTFTDNMGGSDIRWIYEWLVPGHFLGGNGVAAVMSQNGAAQNFVVVENCFEMSEAQIPGWDVMPPAFANVRVWPDTNYTGPYRVWAEITDDQAVGAESVFYRVNQGAWTSTRCDSTAGNRYFFTIPSVTPPAQVDYFVWAKDTFAVNQSIDIWTTWPVCAPESASIRFNVATVAVGEEPPVQPGDEQLVVTPNPFTRQTRFVLNLPGTYDARVEIYAVSGELVRTIDFSTGTPGLEATWDGTDPAQTRLPPGTYLYTVKAGDWSRSGKVLLTNGSE